MEGNINKPLSLSPSILMSDLSTNEKIVLGQVIQFDAAGHKCHLSNDQFGKLIGVSSDRAGRIVNHLIKAGLVMRDHFDGRSRYLAPTSLGRSLGENTDAASVKIPMQPRQIHHGRVGENAEAESVKIPTIKNKIINNKSISNEVLLIEREFFLRNILDYKGVAKRFIDYYEARGWKINGTEIVDKLALARQWELKDDEKKPRFPGNLFNPIKAIADNSSAELIPALANIFRVEIDDKNAIFYVTDTVSKDRIDAAIASRSVVRALNSIGIIDITYKIKI